MVQVHHTLMIVILLQDIHHINLMDAIQHQEHMLLQIMVWYLMNADSQLKRELVMVSTGYQDHGVQMHLQHLSTAILEEQFSL